LFAHCFTCSKDLLAVTRISHALVDRGIAVLRFDFTGLGESEGDFAETNFSSNLDDLLTAADYLRQNHRAPQLLIGHSLGGAAVLAVAAKVPECRAVATLGAPSNTSHLRHSLLRSNPELENADEVEVQLAGRPFRIRREFLDDLAADHVEKAVHKLGRALLVLHSPVDEVVNIDHARKIYQAALHPKSFISLDKADHLLLKNPADAHYVAEVLAAWANRYLELEPPGEPPTAAEPAQLAPGEVRVVGGPHGLGQDIFAGRHRLRADEPTSVGGKDTGPTPYDLLLASLGSCTSMTLQMYANRKGWNLTGVDVKLLHQKIHARDCEECETEGGKVDRIDRTLEIQGDLDDSQRNRLLEIADRCPVHRTMTSETVIHTHLVGSRAEGEES
jgi:putative redox protein